ncbi:MAG TPA: hypothetical protein VL173_05935 [Vicinamibacterales bacterium]|jgi:hypothetical protein|nr:hypothetical protein [Vicinamibacterales bacterium]
MADVLKSFDDPVSNQGRRFHARAVGRQAPDGMWDGWLEFEPLDARTDVIVGPIESRQPEAHDLAYWATGLTPVFLEGALNRALNPLTVRVKIPEVSASDFPAPRMHAAMVSPPRPEAVLDPFEIGERSLDVLRQELRALNRPRLLNIIAAYDLNPKGDDITWMTDAQLATFIVTATEVQLTKSAR